eukprot:g3887.t1
MHRIRHLASLSLESDTAERLSGEVKEQRVAIEESMHLQFKDAISCHREQIEFHRKKLIGLEDNIQKEKAKVDSETKHVERDLKRAQEKEMRLSTNFEKDRVRYAMELEKNLTESVVKAHATAILIRASLVLQAAFRLRLRTKRRKHSTGMTPNQLVKKYMQLEIDSHLPDLTGRTRESKVNILQKEFIRSDQGGNAMTESQFAKDYVSRHLSTTSVDSDDEDDELDWTMALLNAGGVGQDKQEVKEDSKDDQTLYSTKRIDANTSPHGENRTKPVNVEKKEVLGSSSDVADVSHKNADPLTLEGVSEGKSVQQSSKDAVEGATTGKGQKGIERSGTDQSGTDQKSTDQKGTDQKSTDQKGTDQNGTDQIDVKAQARTGNVATLAVENQRLEGVVEGLHRDIKGLQDALEKSETVKLELEAMRVEVENLQRLRKKQDNDTSIVTSKLGEAQRELLQLRSRSKEQDAQLTSLRQSKAALQEKLALLKAEKNGAQIRKDKEIKALNLRFERTHNAAEKEAAKLKSRLGKELERSAAMAAQLDHYRHGEKISALQHTLKDTLPSQQPVAAYSLQEWLSDISTDSIDLTTYSDKLAELDISLDAVGILLQDDVIEDVIPSTKRAHRHLLKHHVAQRRRLDSLPLAAWMRGFGGEAMSVYAAKLDAHGINLQNIVTGESQEILSSLITDEAVMRNLLRHIATLGRQREERSPSSPKRQSIQRIQRGNQSIRKRRPSQRPGALLSRKPAALPDEDWEKLLAHEKSLRDIVQISVQYGAESFERNQGEARKCAKALCETYNSICGKLLSSIPDMASIDPRAKERHDLATESELKFGVEICKKALDLSRSRGILSYDEPERIRTRSTALNNFACLHSLLGRPRTAVRTGLQASVLHQRDFEKRGISIMTHVPQEGDRDVLPYCITLLNVSGLYTKTENFIKALENLGKAETILQNHAVLGDEKTLNMLEIARRNRSAILEHLDKSNGNNNDNGQKKMKA